MIDRVNKNIITKTFPCNIQRFFSEEKNETFIGKFLIYFCSKHRLWVLLDRLGVAVLTSAYNLYFGAKIRKIVYPSKPQIFCIKVGFKGVYISRACFPDVKINYSRLILEWSVTKLLEGLY